MLTVIGQLTEEQKDLIEGLVRHRFYNRITERNVYDWLRNFNQEEIDFAIDILRHIDYYREVDIINILGDSLKPFVAQKKTQLHFIPVGKAGKSGQMIVYIVQGVLKPFFAERHRFHYYGTVNELDVTKLTKNDVLFYVDDVIGSGNTFVKYERGNPNVGQTLKEDSPVKVKLLCVVTTKTGKKRVESFFPTIQVLGEVKQKAFDVDKSVFGSYYRMLPIREFSFKYGKKIESKTSALGYENSQLLVVLSHAVPNNTLPIIWKHKDDFIPLVPRSYAVKGKNAFMDRNEANRWLFFFMHFFPIANQEDTSRLFHDKINYLMMIVLRFKLHGMDDVLIANQLGLHHQDMDVIWERGIVSKLWDKQHKITDACLKRYQELQKLMRIQNTKYSKRSSQPDDEQKYVYVPKTFRGLI